MLGCATACYVACYVACYGVAFIHVVTSTLVCGGMHRYEYVLFMHKIWAQLHQHTASIAYITLQVEAEMTTQALRDIVIGLEGRVTELELQLREKVRRVSFLPCRCPLVHT